MSSQCLAVLGPPISSLGQPSEPLTGFGQHGTSQMAHTAPNQHVAENTFVCPVRKGCSRRLGDISGNALRQGQGLSGYERCWR